MKIKALVTDIDGTLTDQNYRISPEAVKAIRTLEGKGIPVLLASGNSYAVVRALRTYLGCTGALICENGAVIEYGDRLEVIGKKEVGEKALKVLKEKYGDKIVESWQNPYRLGDVAIKRLIERKFVEDVAGKFGLQVLDSGFAYHLIERGVNKAEGLKLAAKLMGIELKEMAAIGDSETDIEMMKMVNMRLTVINAKDSVRRIADYIASKTDGDGMAEAVDFLLFEKGL